ncbi:MAG: hypothetical protein JWN63_1547 [Candidatus Acidoferrum typicum]|nr:hypothetical protein [Candidatus Acidoferrum typicum]
MTSDLIIDPRYGEYFRTSEYLTITRRNYQSDVKVHRDGATRPVLFHCQLETERFVVALCPDHGEPGSYQRPRRVSTDNAQLGSIHIW